MNSVNISEIEQYVESLPFREEIIHRRLCRFSIDEAADREYYSRRYLYLIVVVRLAPELVLSSGLKIKGEFIFQNVFFPSSL